MEQVYIMKYIRHQIIMGIIVYQQGINTYHLYREPIVSEPAHNKTYNKTCVTSKDSAFKSTQYGKGSLLSLFG